MTKMIALLLAVLMLFALCTAEAEEKTGVDDLLGMTIGQLRTSGKYDLRMSVFCHDYYALLLYADGTHYRAYAYPDDAARSLFETASENSPTAYQTCMDSVQIAKAEELTAQPLSKEELDALAGKTLTALAEKGWGIDSVTVPAAEGEEAGTVTQVPVKHKSWYINDEITFWTGPADSEGKVTVSMRKGMFQYNVLVDLPRDAFMEQVRNGKDVWDTKAVSIECAGFSADFASEGFYADGTVRHGGNP